MKKAANLVDKALEVARKVRSVPKKPVKTKGKKTVPEALDWGPGIPLDKLAYLNDEEMALLQANRMFKGKRSFNGIPAFPDPGDTGAGDDSGGSDYGGGDGSDSGAGGDGSYGGGGSGEGGTTGGGSDSGAGSSTGGGSDSGGSSSAGAGAGGGSDSGSDTSSTASSDTSKSTSPSGTSTGPGGGLTSQPARSEPSSYGTTTATPSTTAPTSYSSYGGYDPTSNAPSTMASEATLDRIASGSSVIGNTAPTNYGVPQEQAQVMPTSYGPMGYTPSMSSVVAGDPALQATGTLPQGYAQTGRVANVADMGYPTAPLSESTPPAGATVGYTPTAPAAPPSAPNPFYSSPATQAADIRRAVALARGPAAPPTVINVPGGDLPVGPAQPSVPASEREPTGYTSPAGVAPASYDSSGVAPPSDYQTQAEEDYSYDPNKDPANYVRPVTPGYEDQPSYMSPEQRKDYLASLGDTRSSERNALVMPQRTEAETDAPVKKKKHREKRHYTPYKYRDYMYNDYPEDTTSPDPDVTNFNEYNKRFLKKGGRVGNSIEAALRIAKTKLL